MKRIAIAALLALLAGCNVPQSDYRIPDSGPPVPLSATESVE